MNPTIPNAPNQLQGNLARTLRAWGVSILVAGTLLGTLGLNISCGSHNGSSTPTPRLPPATTGMVSGKVKNYISNQPIAGATVTDGKATTTTFADGTYTLFVTPSDRKQITITASNFGETQRIASVRVGGTSQVNADLLPATLMSIPDLTTGATITVPNSPAQVVLPTNGLVASGGGVPSFPVKASLTPVDPTSNPALMPGDYSTSTGEQIESFGALQVTFTDNKGARLNLALGQLATIRIPLASAYWGGKPPATMPAYYYDDVASRWVKEGTLILGGTDLDQYYEGTVAHFSTWNADMASVTTCITGMVVRNNGTAPVAGAVVTAKGVDPSVDPVYGYLGSYATVTAADGTFTLYVKANAKTVVTASAVTASGLPIVSPTPDMVVTTATTCKTIDGSTINGSIKYPEKLVCDGYLNLTGTLRDFSPSTPYINATLTPPIVISGAGDPYNFYTGVAVPFNPLTPWINPDFEPAYGNQWNNMVKVDLGTDNKPVYNNPAYNVSLIHSAATFNAWFNDFPAPHGPMDLDPYQIQYTIPLAETDPVGAPGIYTYLNDAQFPIDGRLQGNYIYNNPGDGNSGGANNGNSSGHNFHYTYEIHTVFTYKPGQTFTFAGDDDVWVFINKKLVIDDGGIHQKVSKSVDLDTLGLTSGLNYQFDFFYCERHTTESHMEITTSIVFPTTTIPN